MCGFLGQICREPNQKLDKIYNQKLYNYRRGPDYSCKFQFANLSGIFFRLEIKEIGSINNQPYISKCKNFILFLMERFITIKI